MSAAMTNAHNTTPRRLIVGISGASGIVYGVRILQALQHSDIETHLVMSDSARLTLTAETDYTHKEVEAMAFEVHNAKLWGGNLSVLVSLLGTPFWPKVKGGVLFLEDVGEHPYKIERMLTQLLHAGVLAQQKAVVLGQFTSFKLVPHDKGFKLATVVSSLRSQLSIPVLTGLPFGHVPTKVLLPVGAKVDLAVQGRDALLVWGHI